MIAWRILHKRHAHDPLSGTGALKYGGRWNTPGVPIVYAAQTYSLALIELMANVIEYRLLWDFVAIKIKIDDIQGSTTLTVEEIKQISKVINDVNDIVTTIATSVEEQAVTN